MSELAGIEYTRDAVGRKRYVRIDLDMYGENQLVEDFLDLMDALAVKGNSTVTLDDFIKEQNLKRGITTIYSHP